MYLIYRNRKDSRRLTLAVFLINHFLTEPHFSKLSSPVLVALYMFSMGKAEPSPYSNTLERAGMSWVVVTNTFTQLGLE